MSNQQGQPKSLVKGAVAPKGPVSSLVQQEPFRGKVPPNTPVVPKPPSTVQSSPQQPDGKN
jgi:hypothetical protein